VLTLALPIACALPAAGQSNSQDGPVAGRVVIDGSPAPVLPASITRDATGRATVRAIRLSAPLTLDGVLDEDVYSDFQPFGDFVQVTPVAGAPSSERTDVWVMFDETHVYVTCRCWDSSPPEEWIVNEYRRDTPGLRNNETFGVMFDTFYDRRSGSMFYANPLGGRADYSVVDEGSPNSDWNPVWDVSTSRFEGGWSIEMAIPFKSLRYRSGRDQVWGLQLRRSIRHRNEWTYLSPVPAFLAGPQAMNRISSAGTVVGLDLPPAGTNLELKPYGVAGLSTDRVTTPTTRNDPSADAGIDLKYGVTANLTADFTLNTDFAQVEVDEQQVNLTRFSLFFPEKREFFLEGRGLFEFGQGGGGGFGGGGGGGGGGGFGGRGGGDAPSLFYSRRIGFDGGAVVPIGGGGRLTGKMGPWAIGAMNIQTGDVPSESIGGTNFTVVRVKRDILKRSALGLIFTNRSVSLSGSGSNQAYGVDGGFAFFTNLQLDGYYARTATDGFDGDAESYKASISYEGDRYGASAEQVKVGDDFNPEIGFARRSDFRKSAASVRFSPRPTSIAAIRKLTWQANLDFFEDGTGAMESRTQSGFFNAELESSDQFSVNVTRTFERLDEPFSVSSNVAIPMGRYTFTNVRATYQFGPQRRLSGNVTAQVGDFYDGTIKSLTVNQGRVVISDRLSAEPSVTLNLLDLPAGEVRQTVTRLRGDYAFSARMFASTLLQYNSADRTFSSNLRFRWEYQPGSEFFLVWTDERDTRPGGTGLRNRAFALKITKLLRM
jgi:hypothetical protein